MTKKILAGFVMMILAILVFISLDNMANLPFSEFDEANRAEGARNMAKFSYWLAPVTGSPFLRRDDLALEFNQVSKVNIHLERNPLVFLMMNMFSKFWGDSEITYRLPSFLFGVVTIIVLFVYFAKKNVFVAVLAIIPILFSYDWWMSSQMAHLDTGVTFFITLALLILLQMSLKKTFKWWLVSIFIWLAFLIKGQVLVFLVTPIVVLTILGIMKIKDMAKIGILAGVLISFSLLPIWLSVGFSKWFEIYVSGIISHRAIQADMSQTAPIWWYAYWWLYSFRFGMFLFIPLAINDVVGKRINKDKLVILAYIIVNFGLMSMMKNKVWWYVMPLMPAVCIYIYKSFLELKIEKKLFNLFLVFLLSSIPLFWGIEINLKRVMAYSAVVILINSLIILFDFGKYKIKNYYFLPIILLVFLTFSKRFPKPSASFPEVKRLLSDQELFDACVYISNMPYEGVMYYSKAGEVNFWQEKELNLNCDNYLISPDLFEYEIVKEVDRLKLYKVN